MCQYTVPEVHIDYWKYIFYWSYDTDDTNMSTRQDQNKRQEWSRAATLIPIERASCLLSSKVQYLWTFLGHRWQMPWRTFTLYMYCLTWVMVDLGQTWSQGCSSLGGRGEVPPPSHKEEIDYTITYMIGNTTMWLCVLLWKPYLQSSLQLVPGLICNFFD